MGEYVWTMVTIGGKASRAVLDQLAKISTDYFEEGDVDEALKDKSSVTFQGTRNYGNADETEDFCIKHGLSYVLSWAAQPGCFESGSHYWRPGMEKPREEQATDNGNPAIDLRNLKQAAEAGKTIADIIAELSLADSDTVPPLELAGEPDESP